MNFLKYYKVHNLINLLVYFKNQSFLGAGNTQHLIHVRLLKSHHDILAYFRTQSVSSRTNYLPLTSDIVLGKFFNFLVDHFFLSVKQE